MPLSFGAPILRMRRKLASLFFALAVPVLLWIHVHVLLGLEENLEFVYFKFRVTKEKMVHSSYQVRCLTTVSCLGHAASITGELLSMEELWSDTDRTEAKYAEKTPS